MRDTYWFQLHPVSPPHLVLCLGILLAPVNSIWNILELLLEALCHCVCEDSVQLRFKSWKKFNFFQASAMAATAFWQTGHGPLKWKRPREGQVDHLISQIGKLRWESWVSRSAHLSSASHLCSYTRISPTKRYSLLKSSTALPLTLASNCLSLSIWPTISQLCKTSRRLLHFLVTQLSHK